MQREGRLYEPLNGKVLAMIFEKSSTRTRVSFEAGMAQFGGHALFLSPRDTQLGRGEPIEDTARVLSRMVDIVMIRTFEHEKIERFAEYSRMPVINALTDLLSPLPVARRHADLFRAPRRHPRQHRGLDRRRQQYVPLLHPRRTPVRISSLRIAAPEGYRPEASILRAAGDRVDPGRRSGDGRRRRRSGGHRRLGQHGPGRGTGGTRKSLRALSGQCDRSWPPRQRRAVHALPARAPRRGSDARKSSTARRAWYGTRRKTACTRRRRSSSFCWLD